MGMLMEQLTMPENLLAAWRAVRGNIPRKRRERAAGADGITLAEFEQDLAANLAGLREELANGGYMPTPPARIEVPKRDGSRRVIGVLTVRDRVAQRAAHQVLEPLFEPTFLDCSFGFRPGRSAEQAMAYAGGLRRRGLGWVVDGDIANCFDSLDHQLLLALLSRRIKERPLLNLLQVWLEAGVMPAGLPSPQDDLPPYWWQVVKNSTQTGLDWTLEALLAQSGGLVGPGYNSYYPSLPGREVEPGAMVEYEPALPVGGSLRREALKQLVLGGVAVGLSGARAAAGTAARLLGQTLKTPQGRRLLSRGALTTGGVAGAVTLVAVGAAALHQRRSQGPVGTLQGSPLSPLLANVYLHPFDHYLSGRGYHLVRYADDWLIFCQDAQATEAAYQEAMNCLGRLKLKLNPVKTRLLQPGEAVNFLGITLKGVERRA